MQTEILSCNGIDIHIRSMGDRQAPLILFLHGFPEYSCSWQPLLQVFARQFFAVAPDQRGYGLSAKPTAYRLRCLADDMLALAGRLSPHLPFTVVGHDWGASVGYAMAFAQPQRVAKLIVINGVHPITMQRALIEDDAQRAASRYIHDFRSPGAEATLAANGCEKLLGLLSKFGTTVWLTPTMRAGYIEAWSQPGALTGMLNWYRAAPLLVPLPGESVDLRTFARPDFAKFKVRMPHLVIWGMDDQALLPITRRGLDSFAKDLTLRQIAGAGHWVVHQRPDEVIGYIDEFLS
jgi:pimeloyl-ACP methyl ester carboxylesterase